MFDDDANYEASLGDGSPVAAATSRHRHPVTTTDPFDLEILMNLPKEAT